MQLQVLLPVTDPQKHLRAAQAIVTWLEGAVFGFSVLRLGEHGVVHGWWRATSERDQSYLILFDHDQQTVVDEMAQIIFEKAKREYSEQGCPQDAFFIVKQDGRSWFAPG